MSNRKHEIGKILIFIPSYNVEKTISGVIDGVRKEITEAFILVIDDCSTDETYNIARNYENEKLKVIRHPKNMGYGAVQKTAFRFMKDKDFSCSVMIHGDGQHNPSYLKELVKKVTVEGYDMVLGSRMINKKYAISGGMPLVKFFVNILLTKIENLSTGLKLSEFHSGYRAFSKELVKAIADEFLDCMSDGYIFDQQIIFLASYKGFKIGEIPVDTKYDELSHQMEFLPGIKYSFDTITISIRYFLFRKRIIRSVKSAVCI